MKKIAFIISVLLIQACAFTDATLNVSHTPEMKSKGPISDLSSISFSPPEVEDTRIDKERIGWKKNGYGQNTADIYTSVPVEKIVSEAVTEGLIQNGHAVVDDSQIKVEGKVDRFWFETDVNFWTVEFIGDIQSTLSFINNESGEEFYSSTYKGSYSEKVGGGLEKTWTRIMSMAVDKLVEDVMFDEDLLDAISDEFEE